MLRTSSVEVSDFKFTKDQYLDELEFKKVVNGFAGVDLDDIVWNDNNLFIGACLCILKNSTREAILMKLHCVGNFGVNKTMALQEGYY